MVRHPRTPFPEIGGAVIIASGAFQILMGFLMLTNFELIQDAEEASLAYIAAAIAVLIIGPIAVIGGVRAMLRRDLTLATISAVLTTGAISIISMYGVTVYGLALGLVGLILIVASKDEFDS